MFTIGESYKSTNQYATIRVKSSNGIVNQNSSSTPFYNQYYKMQVIIHETEGYIKVFKGGIKIIEIYDEKIKDVALNSVILWVC